eukprot:419864_1
MFTLQLGQQLKHEKNATKEDQQSDSDTDSPQKASTPPSHWFHSYQIPAEPPRAPKVAPKQQRARSKSLGEFPMYEPMNPDHKMEWGKLMPHPHLEDIPKYEPMNPQHPIEWRKMMPHPDADKMPKYEPMNPQHPMDWSKLFPHLALYQPMNPDKKMEWNKLLPHFHHQKNWFHCYQTPNEPPNKST